MKLRTEMHRNPGGRAYVHYQHGVNIDHDAAAAHAYKQAIKEWWNEDEPDNAQIADAAVSWIEQRADEIMHGWGYDDADQGAEVK